MFLKIGLPKIILYWSIKTFVSGFCLWLFFAWPALFTRDPHRLPATRAAYPRPALLTRDPRPAAPMHAWSVSCQSSLCSLFWNCFACFMTWTLQHNLNSCRSIFTPPLANKWTRLHRYSCVRNPKSVKYSLQWLLTYKITCSVGNLFEWSFNLKWTA